MKATCESSASRHDKREQQFIAAVRRIDNKANVAGYVIINPADPASYGRVMLSYPRDGAGRLAAIAWLPGQDGQGYPLRHYGWASGYGYDKASAAMADAEFVAISGERRKLKDNGYGWEHQLRDAGYIIVRAV